MAMVARIPIACASRPVTAPPIGEVLDIGEVHHARGRLPGDALGDG
jgi:hypothetical protein